MRDFIGSCIHTAMTRWRVREFILQQPLKVYFGCGEVKQPGYINVDIRWTPAVDLLGDLTWCAHRLTACCSEVYLSHVLEHYASPGKSMRDQPDTVIGALKKIFQMLEPGGIVRVAVPDFGVIARLYTDEKLLLYPRLLGRICGEQNYPENLHRCIFDKEFLSMCLLASGFERIEEWDPSTLGLQRDASFDELNGVKTSLNLLAHKSAAS